MGIVYKARDTRLNRTVALKFLAPGLDLSPTAKERFLQEAQTASSLDHPNICTIYEADETPDGQLYIAMPFYDGGTLADRIAHGPLSVAEALRIALQIARGLATAHEAGITHRDIKPANIIVTSRGEAKLLDFGIAKLVGDAGKTQPGTIVGTPAYMSPEQARGDQIDHRTDIWALGVVLYEMLAGRPPFRGSQPHEVLLALTLNQPASLRALRRDVPAALDRIVARALAKESARRYGQMRDLISDLERLVGTASTASHPVTVLLEDSMESTALELPSPYYGHRPGWLARLPAFRLWGAVSILLFLPVLAYLGWRDKGGEPERGTVAAKDGRRRILVLPFVNLGPSEESYFSAGITEEIVSRLVGIRQLEVVAQAARAADKDPRQLGTELAVDYILEGTVRWQRSPTGPSRVRITPRLIRASDGSHLWAERYEEVIDEIFRVQSEVAEQVITELDVRLLQPERQRLFARSTSNMEAYELYLKGRHHQQAADATKRTVLAAREAYERAVEIDPTFALAYARLSQVHSFAFHMAVDRTPARLEMARRAAEQALELQPDLPQGHLALAYYHYWGRRDYDSALRELERVSRVQPNSLEVLEARGYIRRRQGDYHSALEDFRKAFALGPGKADLAYAVGTTYTSLKDFAKAELYFDQAI
ncbi:MAG TPA: protein kinase, partial [Thermoanaerobaculia bacterium]